MDSNGYCGGSQRQVAIDHDPAATCIPKLLVTARDSWGASASWTAPVLWRFDHGIALRQKRQRTGAVQKLAPADLPQLRDVPAAAARGKRGGSPAPGGLNPWNGKAARRKLPCSVRTRERLPGACRWCSRRDRTFRWANGRCRPAGPVPGATCPRGDDA